MKNPRLTKAAERPVKTLDNNQAATPGSGRGVHVNCLCMCEKQWIGKKIGKWTVLKIGIRIEGDKKYRQYWRCRCECGNESLVRTDGLRNENTSQCIECADNNTRSHIKHGHAGNDAKRPPSATYNSWEAMKRRCFKKDVRSWKDYGGRGITVCDRWLTFKHFWEDMGDRPKHLQLERIDNDGNYEPGNCKWATAKENVNNRRCSPKNKNKKNKEQQLEIQNG